MECFNGPLGKPNYVPLLLDLYDELLDVGAQILIIGGLIFNVDDQLLIVGAQLLAIGGLLFNFDG